MTKKYCNKTCWLLSPDDLEVHHKVAKKCQSFEKTTFLTAVCVTLIWENINSSDRSSCSYDALFEIRQKTFWDFHATQAEPEGHWKSWQHGQWNYGHLTSFMHLTNKRNNQANNSDEVPRKCDNTRGSTKFCNIAICALNLYQMSNFTFMGVLT